MTFETDLYRIGLMRLIRTLSGQDPALWIKFRSDFSLIIAEVLRFQAEIQRRISCSSKLLTYTLN
jgi:hypothetical protein